MKYGFEDFGKLLDAFSTIGTTNNSKIVQQELLKIVDYPIPVIKSFTESITQMSSKDMTSEELRDKYYGIAALIIIRMNLAYPDFKF